MKKYNWTIDDLKNRYSLLLKMREKETDPEKLLLLGASISNLYEDILDLEVNICDNELKLLTCYNMEKSDLLAHKFLWGDINIFYEEADLKDIVIPPLKTMSLSKDDILELTHDFYKSCLDKFFFHNFLKHYRNRYTNIKFKNNEDRYMGEAIHILSLGESFITIVRDFNIEDVLTAIHEYEHATSVSINPYTVMDQNYTFCEIGSIFMEMIGADYLETIFKNGEAIIAKANEHQKYYGNAFILKSKIDLIEAEKEYYKDGYTNNKALKHSSANYCGLTLKIVDKLIQEGGIPYDYVISYIFAIELYNIYQIDKEKALNILRKLVYTDCKDEETFYKIIKNYGLIPNYHTREYTKSLKDDILKLEKKKN